MLEMVHINCSYEIIFYIRLLQASVIQHATDKNLFVAYRNLVGDNVALSNDLLAPIFLIIFLH